MGVLFASTVFFAGEQYILVFHNDITLAVLSVLFRISLCIDDFIGTECMYVSVVVLTIYKPCEFYCICT